MNVSKGRESEQLSENIQPKKDDAKEERNANSLRPLRKKPDSRKDFAKTLLMVTIDQEQFRPSHSVGPLQ